MLVKQYSLTVHLPTPSVAANLEFSLIKRFQQVCVAFAASVLLAIQAQAQSILRDAETEAFFREVSYPVFEAAGLTPQSVRIYLLNEKSINAFVTGGQNIFFHSGLILAADDVDEFLGVLAHETCHISCGHRIRRGEAAVQAGTFSILSLVLGAAAIALGGSDAGIGILSAGQTVAQRQFLAYTRGEEAEADLAGARYLDAVGVSASGMIRFFEKLRYQEILAQIRQDPYVRSHPLNRTRILNLQEDTADALHINTPPNEFTNERFKRLQAKLAGYLDEPYQTLRKYPIGDKSIAARYARVYAYHKGLEWDLALEEADALIAAEPNNPYFYEIKGQILFENGRVEESVPVLEKALELAPREPLIATALAQSLVSFEDNARMEQAVPILEQATRQDRGNTFAWFNLAKAYSWLDQQPEASLATAERFYSGGAASQALIHARRAMEGFDRGTPQWLRAQDIMIAAESAARNERRRGGRRRIQSNFSVETNRNE